MDRSERVIVVLTRYWPTALSVIRSLAAEGYCIDLIASAHKEGASAIAGASRYVRNYTECICRNVKRMDDPGLLDALLKYGDAGCRPVLFPTDDYTSSFIDRHRDQLSGIFCMPSARGGAQGAITDLMNKETQHRMALEAGLLCPEEWIISLEGDIEIPEDMVYPCFCKPRDSISGVKGEMARCGSETQLRRHLETLRSKNPYREIIVQEFLDIEREVDMSGVCIHDRIIIPGIIRKSYIAEHERGITVAGSIVPLDELEDIRESMFSMLRACDYVGMFDMEFNVVGGKYYYGELNFRSGGPNYAYFLSGVNLPAVTVRGILGEPVSDEDVQVKEYGRKFVYEKVLWKEYLSGCISKDEMDRILDGADDKFLEDENDPVPAGMFYAEIEEELAAKREKDRKRQRNRLTEPFRKYLRMIYHNYPQIYPSNARRFSRKPRVMIVGRNYCTNLCIARSLGMAGYDTEIVRINTKKPEKDTLLDRLMPDAYSKYVKAYHPVRMKKKSRRVADALIRYADKDERMLIIPTEDVAAYVVDEYYNELSRYYILPDVSHTQGEVIRLMSKEYQKELAAAAGLPVLGSRIISIRRGLYEIPEDISYPCFIKPDVSRRARGSKKIMQRCGSREELQTALDAIAADLIDVDMIAEDYAEIGRELSLLGLSYEGESICAGLFEAVMPGHDARRGVAMTGRSIPLTEIQPVMDGIREFLGKTGYNGLFDIDLLETMDGRQYFVEMNLRYGASGYVLTRTGCNLPAMLADRIIRNVPLDTDAVADSTGQTFVSEKVLIEEYCDGLLTDEEIGRVMRGSDIYFVRDDDDPRPYRYLRRAFNKIRNETGQIQTRGRAQEED